MIDLYALLPFWLKGEEIRKLADAFRAVWALWIARLDLALLQADIRFCCEAALALHAEDRQVPRHPGEPLELWRNRVLHAFTAAKEAGSRRGLEFILGVHGVLDFIVSERVPGEDWDIVFVELDPVSFSTDTAILDRIFERWGRTCRRHFVTFKTPDTLYLGTPEYSDLLSVEIAT
jgi:hypothetical protein